MPEILYKKFLRNTIFVLPVAATVNKQVTQKIILLISAIASKIFNLSSIANKELSIGMKVAGHYQNKSNFF